MDKILRIFRVVTKVAKLVTAFASIFCILLICVCLIGIIILKKWELGDKGLKSIIDIYNSLFRPESQSELYTILTIGIIMCFAKVSILSFTHHYFRKVEEAGHPFTSKLSSELFRLGILQIVIPFVGILSSKIAQAFFQEQFNVIYNYSYGVFTFIPLGLFYLYTSCLCRVGTKKLFIEKNNIIE